MDTKHTSHPTPAAAMENVRKTAEQVLRCPACHGEHIYTALTLTYHYDHLSGQFSLSSSVNLAEHGWHGCRHCDHKWVSNVMLQTALPLGAPSPKKKVIDLANHRKPA